MHDEKISGAVELELVLMERKYLYNNKQEDHKLEGREARATTLNEWQNKWE